MAKKSGNFIWRLVFLAIKLFLLWMVLTAGAVLLFRLVPPPFSSVMAQKVVWAWWHKESGYKTHYHWATLQQISFPLALAVLAAEDQRFLTHGGLDFKAIWTAVRHNIRKGNIHGASTISQQAAKNLFLWQKRSWLRKGLELYVTVMIESLWPKERILEVYLNIVQFGNGIFGADQAARIFFHVVPADLSGEQAALLASVLPNPLHFKVDRPSSYVLNRRKWILEQMRMMDKKGLNKLMQQE